MADIHRTHIHFRERTKKTFWVIVGKKSALTAGFNIA